MSLFDPAVTVPAPADRARPLSPAELLGGLAGGRAVGHDEVEDLRADGEARGREDDGDLLGGGHVGVGVAGRCRAVGHVTTPLAKVPPPVAETNCAPAGRVSVKTTPFRFCVPPAASVMPTLYV